MAQRISSSFLIVQGALYAEGIHRSRARRPPRPLLIDHVHVIDATGGPVKQDQTVCLRDGCIDSIAPAGSLPMPSGARTIDASGAYLIPGLWDMHVHLMQAGESCLPLLVAEGVTSVRDVCHAGGASLLTVDAWRARIEAGALIGPRILTPGPSIDDQDWLRQRQHSRQHSGTGLLFPAFSVHDELELLVRGAGVSPQQALIGATRACAEHFGLEHELGTIEPGRTADLVLLDADPLQDIRNTRRIRSVIRGGRLLARGDLDRLVRHVKAAARREARPSRPYTKNRPAVNGHLGRFERPM